MGVIKVLVLISVIHPELKIALMAISVPLAVYVQHVKLVLLFVSVAIQNIT